MARTVPGTTADTARRLIAQAQEESRSGSLDRAWADCRRAAALARALGDAVLMAEAALAIAGPSIADWNLTASRQALCLEAMGMLGSSRPDLRAALATHHAALALAWLPSSDRRGADAAGPDEFADLRARHAAAIGPAGTGARLDIATRTLGLGLARADDQVIAWGRMWRLDAFEQLGLRREFNTELLEWTAVVDRLGSPVWTWRLAAVHTCLALLEDRLDDVGELAEAALRAGAAAGVGEAGFLDLIARSSLAERTGDGLPEVEREVRRAVAAAPLFAQGWRAKLLLRLDRTEEAVGIWRTIEPHLDQLPATTHEWLVAAAGHVDLAIAAGDRAAARRLRTDLRPFGRLHVAAAAMTPYGGPVGYVLGRLDAFLGQHRAAADHFAEAEQRATAMHAPWHAGRARAALAALGSGIAPLSPRETQIAREVAAGRTNRAIAERLFVSDRTVEQHVRTILRKLDLPNRSAIAAWVTRHG